MYHRCVFLSTAFHSFLHSYCNCPATVQVISFIEQLCTQKFKPPIFTGYDFPVYHPYYLWVIHGLRNRVGFNAMPVWCICNVSICLSIYLSGFITAVAVFWKPNAIPLCFSIDLVPNFLLLWLLVLLSIFSLDVLFSFSPVVSIP